MQIRSFLALATVFVASAQAGTIVPFINARADSFLEAAEADRLDLAYQEARIVLGANKVSRDAELTEDDAVPNWSGTCLFTPSILIQPESTDDVVAAVRIIKKYNIKFSIYGGGHSPHPGFAGIEKGALVHFGRMNDTVLSDEKDVISLGPGARWGYVVDQLAEDGVFTSGGRVPIVGVSGLLLGGGMHHTVAEFGMAADNLINAEVVLSDGKIVHANRQENSDLFWALKGGGTNYGIVTRWYMKPLPLEGIWYQWGIWPISAREEVFKAYVDWQLAGTGDGKATASIIVTLTEINLYFIYDAPEVNATAYGGLWDLEPDSWLIEPTSGTFSTLNSNLWGFAGPGQRHEGGTTSFYPDTETYLEVFDVWHEKAVRVHENTGANASFVLQPVSHTVAKIGERNGGNPLGFPAEDHTWWTSTSDWDDAEDDDAARSIALETVAYWDKVNKERGRFIPFKFMNDCAREQNPLPTYGKKNLDRLKKIAAKYDRSGFFQKQQNNGWLVSRS